MRSPLVTISILVSLGLVNCSSSDDNSNTTGVGGTSSVGGGTGVGGTGTLGGTTGTGGALRGGAPGVGGALGGGAPGVGGALGGGAPGVGGAPSGGAPGVGGALSGGAPGVGGALGGGGPGVGGAFYGGSTSAGGVPSMGGDTSLGGVASVGGDTSLGGVPSVGGDTGVGGSVVLTRPKLITSGEGAYWQEEEPISASGDTTVTVDDQTTYQTWTGFGGTFNEKGWAVLSLLSPEERDRAIKLLFDSNDGAGFDWGRIPMGASDYAMDRYTLADTPDDYTMASFSIARDREKLIPYIKAALAIKPDLRLWASPWSPPAWMKDSNNIDGTDADPSGNNSTFKSNMLSDPQILEAYALYFSRFIEEYQAEGITIQQVQPQNEPGYTTRYPSCLWTADLLTTFVRDYLGPKLAEQNPTTEIGFGTMSAEADTAHLNAVTGDATAMGFVKAFGLQWNVMSSVSTLASTGRMVMQTEHKCGNYPWQSGTFNPNTAANDHAYAEESWGLIKDWVKAGVNTYSAWNMVLDTAGKNLDNQRPWPQNALLTVDETAKKLNITPAYYVFRHVSQYVDAGAVRVEASSADALAFKNPDGSIVTILYNAGGSASQTVLGVGTAKLQFTVPAHGWATVNFSPS